MKVRATVHRNPSISEMKSAEKFVVVNAQRHGPPLLAAGCWVRRAILLLCAKIRYKMR